MHSLSELERIIWKQIATATENHDAARLAVLVPIADEMETKKNDWNSCLQNGVPNNATAKKDGVRPLQTRTQSREPVSVKAKRSSLDGHEISFTGRPITAFTFQGREVQVSTYKELLIKLANILREQHGEEFDRRALGLAGRKHRYFSHNGQGLKYGEKLASGGLYIETNLNADLIAKICYSLVRALGGSDKDLQIR